MHDRVVASNRHRARQDAPRALMTQLVGRPSLALEILAVFWRRRMAKIEYRTRNGEARGIQAEWICHFPKKRTPGLTTIRRHLPAAETTAQPRDGLEDVAEGEMR